MSHEVEWTDLVKENFIKRGNLTEDEEFIMRSRCRGFTVTQQADHLKVSDSTVNRMILKLKKRYDAVQKEYPDEFPVRKKKCKQEEFMDKN